MSKEVRHPGEFLNKLISERNYSQRDVAAKLDIAHSLLNNILKGNRNINIKIAIALESAGFENAKEWLTRQVKYDLYLAENDQETIKKRKSINDWSQIEDLELVPLSFFKKQNVGVNTSEDVDKIFEIYGVESVQDLKIRVEKFNPTYFRKSSKFKENKNHVIAWSLLAKYKASLLNISNFKRSYEKELLNALKEVFFEGENVIVKTQDILHKYGIKFFILDRPPQTPVDGKSFMSESNPAIVLSLKYKRLDNFAFTLFHELGHVFEHLTNPNRPELNEEEFFINSSKTDLVEFEADNYARNNLISQKLWNDFINLNEDYSDEIILEFSNKNRIHPGIVRGRVCFEYNEYYRKRSIITGLNKLEAL
ncbi:helix-turn-helix domain-containing protein [Zunongwangia atlantica]|uniref:Addiction module antidote transcriptional regulator, HigA family protein n=1 Tax=Zunongwangia atlantica 22II14-10F7 TaxID=1185767 RepID=A0A1Y1T2N1_9FLAO|nr:helix-turn-helix domain-containing protein [Zunongwangia atlantica]ORL45266.1 addiction module antidote transcriptional regulator, HigA family protein [Zunongwangia atlantica 22II14-10F7]